jgi:hypothetical protein
VVPLTLSHPAAALPLRRLGLPTAALVAGSMAPDVPLFHGRTGTAVAGAVSGIAAGVVKAPSGVHAMAFHGVVAGTLAAVVGFAAVCVARRGLVRPTITQ